MDSRFLEHYQGDLDAVQARMDALLAALKSRVLGTPGAVIGTGSAAKVKLGNGFIVIVDGTQAIVAAATEVALTGSEQAISTKRFYLVSVDSAGSFTCTAGTAVAAASTPALPETPSGDVAVAAVLVETDGATTFDPGTTLLSAAGITDAYYDLDRMTDLSALGAFAHFTP